MSIRVKSKAGSLADRTYINEDSSKTRAKADLFAFLRSSLNIKLFSRSGLKIRFKLYFGKADVSEVAPLIKQVLEKQKESDGFLDVVLKVATIANLLGNDDLKEVARNYVPDNQMKRAMQTLPVDVQAKLHKIGSDTERLAAAQAAKAPALKANLEAQLETAIDGLLAMPRGNDRARLLKELNKMVGGPRSDSINQDSLRANLQNRIRQGEKLEDLLNDLVYFTQRIGPYQSVADLAERMPARKEEFLARAAELFNPYKSHDDTFESLLNELRVQIEMDQEEAQLAKDKQELRANIGHQFAALEESMQSVVDKKLNHDFSLYRIINRKMLAKGDNARNEDLAEHLKTIVRFHEHVKKEEATRDIRMSIEAHINELPVDKRDLYQQIYGSILQEEDFEAQKANLFQFNIQLKKLKT